MAGIKTTFSVDNKNFKKGMKDAQNTAQNSLKKIQSVAKDAQGGFKGLLSILGKLGPVGKGVAIGIGLIGAAIAGAIKIINNLASKMDKIAKSSKSVDMTTTAYQQLNYAAGRSGVSMQKILNILSTLKQKFSSASEGVKETVDSFADLGLSWSELQKKTPEQQLLSILRAAEAIADLNLRNKLLLKIFNKKDVAQIKKMIDVDFGREMASAKIMGVVIDEDAIRMAENYNDSLSLANQRIIAMASNLKATKDAMKTIAEFAQNMTANLSFSDKISEQYKNEYLAIGDVIEQLQKKLPKENVDALNKEVQKLAYEQAIARAAMGQILTQKDYKEIRDKAKMVIYNQLIRQYDARFNVNDKKTWIQRRVTPLETDPARNKEKIIQDKVNAALTRRGKELQQIKAKYLNIVRDLQKELDIEKQIERIEKETGGKAKNGQKQNFINQLLDARLARNEAIIASINKETNSLKDQFQIQKALLEGDLKRAETLKMIARLRQQGINVSEQDFGNVEQTSSQLEAEIAKQKELLKKYQKAHEKYTQSAEYKRQAEDRLKIIPEQRKENKRQYNQQSSLGSTISRWWNQQPYDPEKAYKTVEASLNKDQARYKEILQLAKQAMSQLQAGSKEYLRIQQYIKKLQARKSQVDVVKTAKEQLQLAQKNKTVLDNMTIDKMISDSIKNVELQKAQLSGNDQLIIQLQTINQLKQKGLITDEKDLQRIKEKYQQLLKQKKANKETLDQAKVDKSAKDTEIQNEILKAQIRGDYQRVEALKLINQLKQMGINIDEKELQKNKEKYQELIKQQKLNKELNFQQSFLDQAKGLEYQAMRQAGFAKEAAKLEAIRNAEKQKGAKLTKKQQGLVEQLTELQFKMNKLSNEKPNLSQFEIKTNQLTARGGFASGAVTVAKDRVNYEIKNYSQQTVVVLKQIKDLVQRGGTI